MIFSTPVYGADAMAFPRRQFSPRRLNCRICRGWPARNRRRGDAACHCCICSRPVLAHLGNNGRSFGFRLGGQSGLNADGPERHLDQSGRCSEQIS